jgi:hypothetical protein
VLGTVAWSAVATSVRQQAAAAAHAATHAGQSLSTASAHEAALLMRDHALQVGFGRGFEVAAGIAVLAIVVVLVVIRSSRTSLNADSNSVDSVSRSHSLAASGAVSGEDCPNSE